MAGIESKLQGDVCFMDLLFPWTHIRILRNVQRKPKLKSEFIHVPKNVGHPPHFFFSDTFSVSFLKTSQVAVDRFS